MTKSRPHLLLCSLLFVIIYYGWHLQSHLLFNRDLSWLMHAATKLLQHGTYRDYFFDPNPPMILFLYAPIVTMSSAFSIAPALALYLYVSLLASISLYLCHQFTKYDLFEKDLAPIVSLSIAMIFFILPLTEFGQREHLLIILTFPYIFLLVARLAGKSVNQGGSIITGLLAGFGFCIKPYFLITFVTLELHYLYSKQKQTNWLRYEMGLVLLILCAYLCIIFCYFDDYVHTVVPYASRLYHHSFGQPIKALFFNPITLFSCCCTLAYFFVMQTPQRSLGQILVIVIFTNLVIYLIQQNGFYYYQLPAFSYSLLLLSIVFATLTSQPRKPIYNYLMMICFAFMLGAITYPYMKNVWISLSLMPTQFFGFFIFVFLFLFYSLQKEKKIIIMSASVTFLIVIAYLFANMLMFTTWYQHQFILTIILMVLLFILLAPKQRCAHLHVAFFAFFSIVLFAFPFYFATNFYQSATAYKNKMAPLTAYIRQHAHHQSVYFFSTMVSHAYPTIQDAGAITASRFSCFWMLPGLINSSGKPQYNLDKEFFIDMVTQDLVNNNPAFVFIDTNAHKAHITNPQFNYLHFFMQNKNFQSVWQSYHYLTTLTALPSPMQQQPLFQYEIYARS